MSDLVERLRFQTRYTHGQVSVTMDKAADRIEALESKVEMHELSNEHALQQQVNQMRESNNRYRAALEKLAGSKGEVQAGWRKGESGYAEGLKAAPSQEPFAYYDPSELEFGRDKADMKRGAVVWPLYLTPPDAAAQIAELIKERDDRASPGMTMILKATIRDQSEQIAKLEAAARMALIQMLKQAEEMPCHYDDYFEAINALREALK